jgi:hypothetical protein
MAQMTTPTALPAEVTNASRVSVHEIRGERVVLDHEVARLFGVETRKLNQQVTRNKEAVGWVEANPRVTARGGRDPTSTACRGLLGLPRIKSGVDPTYSIRIRQGFDDLSRKK